MKFIFYIFFWVFFGVFSNAFLFKDFSENQLRQKFHHKKNLKNKNRKNQNENIDYDLEIISKLKLQIDLNNIEEIKKAKFYLNENILKFVTDSDTNIIGILCAEIEFNDTLFQIGWSKLKIKTFDSCDKVIQIWAAGFLEGIFTYKQIDQFYENLIISNKYEEKAKVNLYDFYERMEKSLKERLIDENIKKMMGNEKLFYSQVALTKIQTEGLLIGHNLVSNKKKSIFDMYFINADGEIPELLSLFSEKNLKKNDYESYRYKEHFFSSEELFSEYDNNDPEFIWLKIMSESHCSAFFKILKNDQNFIEDFLISHSTWDEYSSMIRIFKEYEFPNKIITFSSYPGCLTSTDDFYIIDSNLIVMETSLEILNKKLYKNVLSSDEYIPNYMRIMTSNKLSLTSVEWSNWIQFINTGTYNTQWMILDLNKFKQSIGKNELLPFTFIMTEQIPGKMVSGDLSSVISEKQYWAAYNVPFFPEIRIYSGFEIMNKKYNSQSYSFDNNIRGQIFRNYQSKIKDISSLQSLMLLNNYNPELPIENSNSENYLINNPVSTLAVRYDLISDLRLQRNSGLIDTKITNFNMANKHSCFAISGPTHQNQIPFQFSKSNQKINNFGIPDKWDFDWIEIDFNQ